MIKFERNIEQDLAMKNLLISMVDMSDYLSAVLNYTGKILTPRQEKELIKILKKYRIPHEGLKYDVKILSENPYFRDIHLEEVSSPTVKYDKATIKKRTLINMNFHQPLGKYLFHHHPMGYFESDIDLPVLMEGDKVWMSPAVSEIESMRPGIKRGHGKCLTFGLGIGVLPYLWLLKDEVEEVTVVEFNQDVIDLFEIYIRPQFKTNKNLKIIHGNAFDYYNEEFLNRFDYVYVDFWESNEDGLELYTRLMEKKITLTHIDYWVEDSILSDLKYLVASYLHAVYDGKGITDFLSATDDEMMPYAKKINRYFKKRTDLISTEDQLLGFIHGIDVLREILGQ
ncbi:hypothetical protein [Dehalobacterium formicoaceticum]|uniref:hypothetical protein n=1 Tax=Dehalobacterium formicoaceticum TaxID=51515 RepID=UPI0031F6A468